MYGTALKEANIKKVIAAAINCFIDVGIEESTMPFIAKKSGLTTRTLCNLFGTKANLAVKAMAKFTEDYFAPIHTLIKSEEYASKNGFDEVTAIIRFRGDLLQSNPDAVLLMTEMEVFCAKHKVAYLLYEKYLSNLKFTNDHLNAALKRGVNDGSIRNDININRAVELCAETYEGFLHRLAVTVATGDPERKTAIPFRLERFYELVSYYLSSHYVFTRNGRTHKMLIVDDIEESRIILSRCFENEYTIVQAENGLKALAYLTEHNDIDILILDLFMPVMDGFTLLSHIRADHAFDDMAIIIATLYGESENENKALELGADEFIAKPFNIRLIQNRVRNMVVKYEHIAESRALKQKLAQEEGMPSQI